MTAKLSVTQLLEALDRARARVDSTDAVLTFDGDGTLWSGDVGDDVFFHAIEHEMLRDEARPALQRLAIEHGLDGSGSPAAIARRIYGAHQDEVVSQPATYAMMAWCFAGHTIEQLKALSRDALDAAGLGSRLHAEVQPILSWARRAGLRTMVISASPHPVVELAAEQCGFTAIDIVAVRPFLDPRGCIGPAVDGVVPYGSEKVQLGRERLGAARWLAAFGDNDFDAAMLVAADIGVAVRPKPGLRTLLPTLESVVELLS